MELPFSLVTDLLCVVSSDDLLFVTSRDIIGFVSIIAISSKERNSAIMKIPSLVFLCAC